MNTTSAIGDDQARELADGSKRQADAAIAARETGFVATVVDGDAVIGRPNCGRSTRRIRDADATPVLGRHGVAGAMRDLDTRGPVIQRNRPQTAARNAR